ncbi:MAG: 2Fe-2S iron-sulfur cluster binding domain-containing protein [Bacteroidetes bacterium]|nr:2Fe-2S iron-sulfur cluster binding domain-containing protein [Bacteroidota bacterium]
MKVVIKNSLIDTISFITHITKRYRLFAKASDTPLPKGIMNTLSASLHPTKQDMVIRSIMQETADTITYRLVMNDAEKKPAFFRAGQYISCSFMVDKSTASRPFSISSTPGQAIDEGFYDITIKKTDPGFISKLVYNTWKVGTQIVCTAPAGDFYYQELRDSCYVICLAGGSGVTPFKSIIPNILKDHPDVHAVLIHGAVLADQFIFSDYFKSINDDNPSHFTYIPVCSDPAADWQGERGLITISLIEETLRAAAPDKNIDDCTLFVSGPPAMETYLEEEFIKANIQKRRIRVEHSEYHKSDGEKKSPTYSLLVHMNTHTHTIKAQGDETVLVALERAGLNPPSLCRSGTCGWCRSRLLSGTVVKAPHTQGTRSADDKFGYFHPCSEFPTSDVEMYIPDDPIRKREEQE